MAKKTLLSLTYKRSKLCHEMVLLTLFLPICVFILVFTVFASIVSGFWLFLLKPPLKNPRLQPKVLKAPLLYLGPRLGFSRGFLIYRSHEGVTLTVLLVDRQTVDCIIA